MLISRMPNSTPKAARYLRRKGSTKKYEWNDLDAIKKGRVPAWRAKMMAYKAENIKNAMKLV